MKKLVSALVALTFVLGTAAVSFAPTVAVAQEKKKDEKKKKAPAKKKDEKKKS